jgi:hypothetical protein
VRFGPRFCSIEKDCQFAALPFNPAEQVHNDFHPADSAILFRPESPLFLIQSATSIEAGVTILYEVGFVSLV